MRYIFAFLFLGISLNCISQDVMKLMHYNLLNYGNYTDYCTSSNNFVDNKDDYLRTIIDYVQPDVLTVNEIDELPYYHERILDEVMNSNGRDYYNRATSISYANSYTVNMLYYDTRKFVLHSEDVAQTLLRDINVYKLYYKDPELHVHKDTAFLICLVAHLKAGSSSSDEQTRGQMMSNMMNYLDDIGVADNYILMGDFNVYSGDEAAIQNVLYHTNNDIRFYDPIDMIGDWNNNSYYAECHTQSTHETSNGCAASGGMDDRFDFILLSANILNGLGHYSYKDQSYNALGQDGNRFNGSIISPSNSSVPYEVANALYGMSDHLPVILELDIDQEGADIRSVSASNELYCRFNNPIEDILYLKTTQKEKFSILIYNSLGQIVSSFENIQPSECKFPIDMQHLKKGVYFMQVKNATQQSVYKLIKE